MLGCNCGCCRLAWPAQRRTYCWTRWMLSSGSTTCRRSPEEWARRTRLPRPRMPSIPPIKVNRAPVLTLWAAVVAERLGHPPDTALSLASAVAGTAARAKARRLGFSEERDHAKDARAAAPARPQDTVQLLGRKIRLTHDADGVV